MALNEFLEQYADLELEKMRNVSTLQGLWLNEQRLSAKVSDIVGRVGQISNVDGEMTALSDQLNESKWYQFIQNANLNKQLAQAQQVRATFANELRALHGVNPEGAIEAATKLNAQIQKSKILSEQIVTPENIDRRQRAIEKSFSKQCFEAQRSEKIGLPREFYRQRNLSPEESAALKAAEKKFQATSAVTWEQQEKSYRSPNALHDIKQKAENLQQQLSSQMTNWVNGIRQHPFFQRNNTQSSEIIVQRKGERKAQQKAPFTLYKDNNGQLHVRKKQGNAEDGAGQSSQKGTAAVTQREQQLENQIKMLEEELRKERNKPTKLPPQARSSGGGSDQAQRERNLAEKEQNLRQREAAIDDRQAKEAMQKNQTDQDRSTQEKGQNQPQQSANQTPSNQSKGASQHRGQQPTRKPAVNQNQAQTSQPSRTPVNQGKKVQSQPTRVPANDMKEAATINPTRTPATASNQASVQAKRSPASSPKPANAPAATRTPAASSGNTSASGQAKSSSQSSGKSSGQSSGRSR